MSLGTSRKGFYTPNNPHKYMGDNINKILYRSSWEKKVFSFCDNNMKVLGWEAEPFPIPYIKPLENNKIRKANYWPDLYVEYVDKDNKFVRAIIEIKPYKQTIPSKAKKAIVRLQENYVLAVNRAKWEACKLLCDKNDLSFWILTERSIFY